MMLNMLKKKLGAEAIERLGAEAIGGDWENWKGMSNYFKIPSTLAIPEGCKKIKRWAFYCCERLKKVIIPESVRWIGDKAFWGCVSAVITIEVQEGDVLRYISPNAFLGCKRIGYVKEEIRS